MSAGTRGFGAEGNDPAAAGRRSGEVRRNRRLLKNTYLQVLEQLVDEGKVPDIYELVTRSVKAQVAAAEKGDPNAMRDLLDRTFGKPIQSIKHEVDSDPTVRIEMIGKKK